jgi:hypothetical protein
MILEVLHKTKSKLRVAYFLSLSINAEYTYFDIKQPCRPSIHVGPADKARDAVTEVGRAALLALGEFAPSYFNPKS